MESMGGGEEEDHCVQHPAWHNVQKFEGTYKKPEEDNTNSEKEIPFVKWPWCWVSFPSVLFSFSLRCQSGWYKSLGGDRQHSEEKE